MRSPRAAAALLCATLLTACSGGGSAAAPSTPTPTATPTPSATPSPTPSPTASTIDLLTGTTPRRSAPLVAVKVDNAVLARPYQRGLKAASIVYQELVEGGSTRLLAVLESDAAPTVEVGPIRSARETDIDLLRQYGGISIGFSGANTGVTAEFNSAARKGYLVNASYDEIPGAYRLAEHRRDAQNFFTQPGKIVSRKPGKGPTDIGLRFGALPAGGQPVTMGTATFSGQSALRVRPSGGAWVLSQGGTVLPVSPANVIIQYVTVLGSRYMDVHGNPTPYTVTTGGGRAVILRDGVRLEGHWKRTGYGATHFLDAHGRDLLLKAGPSWVVLLPSAGSLSTS
jgi:hypothetical protein